MNEIAVFAGSAGVEFATEMCAELGVELKPSRIQRFANDCLEAQLLTNCRQRDVFIVQPLVAPVQENLMELLLMIDAARGASAGRITHRSGTARKPARCSIGWWVGPSSPSPIESWVMT